MIANIINKNIRREVDIILTGGILNNKITNPETLSGLVTALIVVHIKYWQFEDNIEEIDDLATIGKLKQDTNSLFKVDRPRLIKSIDGIILELLTGGYSSDKERCALERSILENINHLASIDDFDLLYSDTLSELIDKLTIIQIRRWYLKRSLLNIFSKDVALKLDTIDNEKIPMLVKCLDKLLVLIASDKVIFVPVNVKFYSGVTE